jgi:signal transduction histidine kinase
VVSSDDLIIGRLFVFRDVTNERAADRLKIEFVSLVSHELRTPLTSIKGYIELLAAGDVGPLTADQLEFLGIAKSNADRLVSLINDLLDISRIEAGKDATHALPVVMMTANPGLLELHRATIEALGGLAVASKPCTPEELAAILRRRLEWGHSE